MATDKCKKRGKIRVCIEEWTTDISSTCVVMNVEETLCRNTSQLYAPGIIYLLNRALTDM